MRWLLNAATVHPVKALAADLFAAHGKTGTQIHEVE